jgi:simple sugar transport system permease protein
MSDTKVYQFGTEGNASLNALLPFLQQKGIDPAVLYNMGNNGGFFGNNGFESIIALIIVAALFGGLHPLWTIPASLLFGGLLVGANAMQRAIQVPASLVIALNGLVVIFVVASNDVRRRVNRAVEVRE